MSAIIAYFSRAGGNYIRGEIKDLCKGNTETAAEIIQKLTGADLFKIEPICEYSSDYSKCIDEAKQDKCRGARPELKAYPGSIDKYDTVYLGYPNYWGTMPMAVFTFLEKYDFTGKTIKPFCTHEGSGMGSSENDIKNACPAAKVKRGIAIYGSRAEESESDIKKWLIKAE